MKHPKHPREDDIDQRIFRENDRKHHETPIDGNEYNNRDIPADERKDKVAGRAEHNKENDARNKAIVLETRKDSLHGEQFAVRAELTLQRVRERYAQIKNPTQADTDIIKSNLGHLEYDLGIIQESFRNKNTAGDAAKVQARMDQFLASEGGLGPKGVAALNAEVVNDTRYVVASQKLETLTRTAEVVKSGKAAKVIEEAKLQLQDTPGGPQPPNFRADPTSKDAKIRTDAPGK